ncbi:MAG: DNA polymerase III subunit delta [Chlorobi bacterium]|nr:DNA polymerase III subunit delta [Chlorobiota bacterium]
MANKDFRNIIRDITQGNISPVYFLAGEESYFGRKIEEALLEHVVPPQARGFDLAVLYAQDLPLNEVLARARQYPMFGGKQMVAVRNAHLYFKKDKDLELIRDYVASPPPHAVLSFRFEGKPGAKIKKAFTSPSVLYYEAPRIYENRMPSLLADMLAARGFKADTKALLMLAEHTGTDLMRAEKELDKLALALEPGQTLTPDAVEKYTGVSKEFNIFEFKSAVVTGNFPKAYRIGRHFSHNPREFSLHAIIAVLYNFFVQLYTYLTLPESQKRDKRAVASALKINPFFVPEYQQAARVYPMKRVSRAISALRDTDLKAKGVHAGQADYADLMHELLYKIMLKP